MNPTILAQAQQGDREAIAQVIDQYEPMISCYLRRFMTMIGSSDPHLRDEKRQECRLRILDCLQRYQPDGNWPSYIGYSLRQTMFLKRVKGRPTVPLAAYQDPGREDPVLIQMEWADEIETLRARIEQLPRRHRRYLNLKFGLKDGVGRTHVEVAQIMGVPRNRIAQLHHDSLTHLRSLYHVDHVPVR